MHLLYLGLKLAWKASRVQRQGFGNVIGWCCTQWAHALMSSSWICYWGWGLVGDESLRDRVWPGSLSLLLSLCLWLSLNSSLSSLLPGCHDVRTFPPPTKPFLHLSLPTMTWNLGNLWVCWVLCPSDKSLRFYPIHNSIFVTVTNLKVYVSNYTLYSNTCQGDSWLCHRGHIDLMGKTLAGGLVFV